MVISVRNQDRLLLEKQASKVESSMGYVAIYDNNANLIAISDPYAKALHVSKNELRGISLTEFLRPADNSGIRFVREVAKYMRTSRNSVNEIYLWQNQAVHSQSQPIFNLDNVVVGHKTRILPVVNTQDLNLTNLFILSKRYGVHGFNSHDLFDRSFSAVEQKVIFGLLMNYSLQEIAKLINKSRIYVSKIISDKLCMKFNIHGYSSRFLTEVLVAKGYSRFIPQEYLFNSLSVYQPHQNYLIELPKFKSKQLQVLGLLLLGDTHESIARKLGCSSAAVTKLIKTSIQPAFAVAFKHSKDFVKYLFQNLSPETIIQLVSSVHDTN